MIPLAIRNLKLYFRDRTAVFFSLLAVFIIIGLYVLFLGDTITADLTEIKGARFLMDSWIMAGLLAVTSVPTTMGAASVVVERLSLLSPNKNLHSGRLPDQHNHCRCDYEHGGPCFGRGIHLSQRRRTSSRSGHA